VKYSSECKQKPAASCFTLCAECIRSFPNPVKLKNLHAHFRQKQGLPPFPPDSEGGLECRLCRNSCKMKEGEWGYCYVRCNTDGKLKNRAPAGYALLHTYYDPLPTNCCASWFCSGSREEGVSLAVFFYGCSFDCLYCQNFQHKMVEEADVMSEKELVKKSLEQGVRCVCFFGGSPEPQLPFALRVSKKIVEKSRGKVHICWEWNGSANPVLTRQAAELSRKSGGTVKFDLKAFNPNLHLALCGVDNQRTLNNFKMLSRMYSIPGLITATTLLVSYYVDGQEVEKIASFIASNNPQTPYSLLVFHPDFLLDDLPITPREQVFDCYDRALKYLQKVNIGNRQLL